MTLLTAMPSIGEGAPPADGFHWRDGAISSTSAHSTIAPAGPERLGARSVDWEYYFNLGVRYEESISRQAKTEPVWRVRALAGVGTRNMLSDFISGEVAVLEDTYFYGVTLGRTVVRDPWNIPIDLSLNAGVFHHLSGNDVDDIAQFLFYLQLDWTKFPWDHHLRTRLGVSEGISYVTAIPYTEVAMRNGKGSKRLLNYLEFTCSLNLADLLTITGARRLFPDGDVSSLEHAWLTAAVHHRSGANGAYGSARNHYGRQQGVGEGSNYLSIGATLDF